MEVNKQSLKLKASFLFLVCLFVVGAQAATEFKYCYKHGINYDLKVQTLNISPFPVDPNKPWTFNVTATSPGEWIRHSCYQRDIEIFIDYTRSIRDSIKLDSCDYTTFNGSTSIVMFSHTQPPRNNDPPLRVKVSTEDETAIRTCFEFKIKSKTKSS